MRNDNRTRHWRLWQRRWKLIYMMNRLQTDWHFLAKYHPKYKQVMKVLAKNRIEIHRWCELRGIHTS